MSELSRLASIPMVSLKMFSILLNDSLGYLLQGSDIATQLQPVEVWFREFYETRHQQPPALLQNSHAFATREIVNIIRNVHGSILAHASVHGGGTVLSAFDTSVLYTFYVVRTIMGEPAQALQEEVVFDLSLIHI